MNDQPQLATSIAGVAFANPVWVGSSELTMTREGILALLASGAGAVVAKSVNENEAARKQLDIADYAFLNHDWERVTAEIADRSSALLNRSGLVQQSLDDWLGILEETRRAAEGLGSALIGSTTIGNPAAAPEIVRALSSVTGHVEVNVGAPHAREASSGAVNQMTSTDGMRELVERIRPACDGLLLLKLPDAGPLTQPLVGAAYRAGADAVVLTGRQLGFLPDVHALDPQLGSWGAYSSPATLPMSLYAVSKAYAQTSKEFPLVGTNGARDSRDVFRFLLSGAHAVELVTALWVEGPSYVSTVLRGLAGLLDQSPFEELSEAVGASVTRARAYEDIEPVIPPARPWAQWID